LAGETVDSNNRNGLGRAEDLKTGDQGRIPDELRAWVREGFPENDLLQSLDELNEQACLELSEFLDLNELERVVASEQAERKR